MPRRYNTGIKDSRRYLYINPWLRRLLQQQSAWRDLNLPKIFTFWARPKHYVAVLSQMRNAVVFQSKFEFARQVKKA